MKTKAVFIDRDGVINKYPGDFDYVKSWDEFQFLSGVKPALKQIRDKGFLIFIISNQAGVSKGIYSKEALDLITRNMLKELSDYGVDIAGIYYCIHRPEDNCSCRKPKTGLIDMAIAWLKTKGLQIDFKQSYFIGDAIPDVEAGKARGLKTILIFSGKEKPENKKDWINQPDFIAKDLSEAANTILK